MKILISTGNQYHSELLIKLAQKNKRIFYGKQSKWQKKKQKYCEIWKKFAKHSKVETK